MAPPGIHPWHEHPVPSEPSSHNLHPAPYFPYSRWRPARLVFVHVRQQEWRPLPTASGALRLPLHKRAWRPKPQRDTSVYSANGVQADCIGAVLARCLRRAGQGRRLAGQHIRATGTKRAALHLPTPSTYPRLNRHSTPHPLHLQHDDSLLPSTYAAFTDVLDGRRSANGCVAAATFFTTRKNTGGWWGCGRAGTATMDRGCAS